MKFSFLITGKKYIKYDFLKNTFGEDYSPPPFTMSARGWDQNQIRANRGFSTKKEVQKGKNL